MIAAGFFFMAGMRTERGKQPGADVDDAADVDRCSSADPAARLPAPGPALLPPGVPPRPVGRRCRPPPLGHVRRVPADLDPGVPLSGAGTLRDRVDEALARWWAPALRAGLLALVTLVLTMGGAVRCADDGGGPADARAGDPGGPRGPRGLVTLDGARRGVAARGGGGAGRSLRRGAADAAAREPALRHRSPATPRHWPPPWSGCWRPVRSPATCRPGGLRFSTPPPRCGASELRPGWRPRFHLGSDNRGFS